MATSSFKTYTILLLVLAALLSTSVYSTMAAPHLSKRHQPDGYRSPEGMGEKASERIWKPRCSATIAWEQTQGISVKDKTSKYTGPRGDWSQGYGYITRDGFCPCGASLATHEDRTCPGATKNPRAADERLLESLSATIVAQSQVSDRTVTDGWFTEEFGLRQETLSMFFDTLAFSSLQAYTQKSPTDFSSTELVKAVTLPLPIAAPDDILVSSLVAGDDHPTTCPSVLCDDGDSSEEDPLINRALERRRGQQKVVDKVSLAHASADNRTTTIALPDLGSAVDPLQDPRRITLRIPRLSKRELTANPPQIKPVLLDTTMISTMLKGIFFVALLPALMLQVDAWSVVTIDKDTVELRRENGYHWKGGLRKVGIDEKGCYDGDNFCVAWHSTSDCVHDAYRDYTLYVDGRKADFRCYITQDAIKESSRKCTGDKLRIEMISMETEGFDWRVEKERELEGTGEIAVVRKVVRAQPDFLALTYMSTVATVFNL
ncbi:hypothetical protein K457DRAFT_24765 [Linnemannia elongata AG-77]|uniref:Uncharacterized protein n=1 Tax=Linnemannia elongata AG-77 TaxID=1314771 RepID=A0A197JEY0_9FUNG|nr:hypothetical protein K457DRAFT_24765 [Linnemannia elongata AG-77]